MEVQEEDLRAMLRKLMNASIRASTGAGTFEDRDGAEIAIIMHVAKLRSQLATARLQIEALRAAGEGLVREVDGDGLDDELAARVRDIKSVLALTAPADKEPVP